MTFFKKSLNLISPILKSIFKLLFALLHIIGFFFIGDEKDEKSTDSDDISRAINKYNKQLDLDSKKHEFGWYK